MLGRPRAKLYGVAVNDADYPVNWTDESGKSARCPIFSAWKDIITRCCNKEYQNKHISYLGASVCDEWLSYMNFYRWAIKQDWKGNRIDKDIIKAGNKRYSPETCAFVPIKVNAFAVGDKIGDGGYAGVSWHKVAKKFISQCRSPFTDDRLHLGYFDNAKDAHSAWKKRKHELAIRLAELQADSRVAEALRVRYL